MRVYSPSLSRSPSRTLFRSCCETYSVFMIAGQRCATTTYVSIETKTIRFWGASRRSFKLVFGDKQWLLLESHAPRRLLGVWLSFLWSGVFQRGWDATSDPEAPKSVVLSCTSEIRSASSTRSSEGFSGTERDFTAEILCFHAFDASRMRK